MTADWIRGLLRLRLPSAPEGRRGSLSRTLRVRSFQQRWWRVSGKTSARVAQNPRPPSPTANRGGAVMPHSRSERSTPAQDSRLSR